MDCHASCRCCDWSAIAGASGACSNPTGSSFSVRAKAQSLVTHGLYSRIRNPIYLFGCLVVVEVLLYINKPRALWLLVGLIPLQIYRARQEEKVLGTKFGAEYQQYKSCTWF